MKKTHQVITAFKKWFSNKKRVLKLWYLYRKNMLLLWSQNAPKEQRYLTKGAYYIRKGAIFQVGQPVTSFKKNTNKKQVLYISNILFNFRQNKITATYSKRPVKDLTQNFINESSR